MDRGMANVCDICFLIVSHHHLLQCRIVLRQPCLRKTEKGEAEPIRLPNLRQIQLQLDGRCEQGSFRHTEVGHRAHTLFFVGFFLDFYWYWMRFVTSTVESVIVFDFFIGQILNRLEYFFFFFKQTFFISVPNLPKKKTRILSQIQLYRSQTQTNTNKNPKKKKN